MISGREYVTYLAADRLGLLPDPNQDVLDLLAAVVNYSGHAKKPKEPKRPRPPRAQSAKEISNVLKSGQTK